MTGSDVRLRLRFLAGFGLVAVAAFLLWRFLPGERDGPTHTLTTGHGNPSTGALSFPPLPPTSGGSEPHSRHGASSRPPRAGESSPLRTPLEALERLAAAWREAARTGTHSSRLRTDLCCLARALDRDPKLMPALRRLLLGAADGRDDSDLAVTAALGLEAAADGRLPVLDAELGRLVVFAIGLADTPSTRYALSDVAGGGKGVPDYLASSVLLSYGQVRMDLGGDSGDIDMARLPVPITSGGPLVLAGPLDEQGQDVVISAYRSAKLRGDGATANTALQALAGSGGVPRVSAFVEEEVERISLDSETQGKDPVVPGNLLLLARYSGTSSMVDEFLARVVESGSDPAETGLAAGALGTRAPGRLVAALEERVRRHGVDAALRTGHVIGSIPLECYLADESMRRRLADLLIDVLNRAESPLLDSFGAPILARIAPASFAGTEMGALEAILARLPGDRDVKEEVQSGQGTSGVPAGRVVTTGSVSGARVSSRVVQGLTFRYVSLGEGDHLVADRWSAMLVRILEGSPTDPMVAGTVLKAVRWSRPPMTPDTQALVQKAMTMVDSASEDAGFARSWLQSAQEVRTGFESARKSLGGSAPGSAIAPETLLDARERSRMRVDVVVSGLRDALSSLVVSGVASDRIHAGNAGTEGEEAMVRLRDPASRSFEIGLVRRRGSWVFSDIAPREVDQARLGAANGLTPVASRLHRRSGTAVSGSRIEFNATGGNGDQHATLESCGALHMGSAVTARRVSGSRLSSVNELPLGGDPWRTSPIPVENGAIWILRIRPATGGEYYVKARIALTGDSSLEFEWALLRTGSGAPANIHALPEDQGGLTGPLSPPCREHHAQLSD